jgi:hypothetical protein
VHFDPAAALALRRGVAPAQPWDIDVARNRRKIDSIMKTTIAIGRIIISSPKRG